MAMAYSYVAIPDAEVPRAARPLFQHMVDTYASETNKVVSLWREFRAEDMGFRPHERSMSVADVMKHEMLSERRFFGEFLGAPEPAAESVLPASQTPLGSLIGCANWRCLGWGILRGAGKSGGWSACRSLM
jgi:hypothetical protein